MLSVVFAAATLVGMTLSACELFHLRSALTAFLLPFLATLLALFNILGAGAKHSAILEKRIRHRHPLRDRPRAIDGQRLRTGGRHGISLAVFHARAGGRRYPRRAGRAVHLVAGGLFGVNRRDYILVLSSIAIGLMIPLLIRTFPFTLR